ncbi:hypothetical protein IV203_026200 [Nitzschia inconspicua]|uniref:Uncharacterized protein n=1 Tax=Nitzschia inconspicua TaxID=303405 RepID=A0A9K3LI62_9STRA|nr:hypothetical protein IV203_026200 [Nitzschia inconspicua]
MTGGTTLDMAIVHVETQETFDNVHSDKIAEAEALAAEALRMANEAKRAAERLAEVKKTLAMFSKKLDKVEKVVLVEKVSKSRDEDATPFEADKAAKKEDAPVKEDEAAPIEAEKAAKKEDAPIKAEENQIEEPVKEELPPAVEEEEEEFVPPPPPVVQRAIVSSVALVEEDKDFLEATLDSLGVDKICGVDDETLAKIQAEELGLPAPVIVKKVGKKATSVVARKIVPAPKVANSSTSENRIVATTDDDGKDFLEKTLDSWGVDRLCGVDDVTLGLATSHPEPTQPPKPVPFENPTRIEYKKVPALEIVHSESLKEQRSKEIREQLHLPQKVYQRAPTNFEFSDPFGVDHDDLIMCGKLADLCEPDLDALQQPEAYYTLPAPIPRGEPEKSILKKETPVSPKEDAVSVDIPKDVPAETSSKNVKFQEVSEDSKDL